MEGTIAVAVFDKLSTISGYSKTIVIALGTTCVLAFMGLWNSLESSWFESRIRLHQNQLRWIEPITCKKCGENVPILPDSIIPKKQREDFNKAYKYFHSHHYTKKMVQEQLLNYSQARIESIILLKIPFFGVTVDINDLGVFSGMSFTAVLSLLFYTLTLKYNYLKSCFMLIKDLPDKSLIKKGAYTLLKSNQTFSIPVPTEKKLSYLAGFSIFGKMLYTFPLSLEILIFLNDFRTYNAGELINKINTISGLYMTGMSIVSIALFTALCFYIQTKIDTLWTEIAVESRQHGKKILLPSNV